MLIPEFLKALEKAIPELFFTQEEQWQYYYSSQPQANSILDFTHGPQQPFKSKRQISSQKVAKRHIIFSAYTMHWGAYRYLPNLMRRLGFEVSFFDAANTMLALSSQKSTSTAIAIDPATRETVLARLADCGQTGDHYFIADAKAVRNLVSVIDAIQRKLYKDYKLDDDIVLKQQDKINPPNWIIFEEITEERLRQGLTFEHGDCEKLHFERSILESDTQPLDLSHIFPNTLSVKEISSDYPAIFPKNHTYQEIMIEKPLHKNLASLNSNKQSVFSLDDDTLIIHPNCEKVTIHKAPMIRTICLPKSVKVLYLSECISLKEIDTAGTLSMIHIENCPKIEIFPNKFNEEIEEVKWSLRLLDEAQIDTAVDWLLGSFPRLKKLDLLDTFIKNSETIDKLFNQNTLESLRVMFQKSVVSGYEFFGKSTYEIKQGAQFYSGCLRVGDEDSFYQRIFKQRNLQPSAIKIAFANEEINELQSDLAGLSYQQKNAITSLDLYFDDTDAVTVPNELNIDLKEFKNLRAINISNRNFDIIKKINLKNYHEDIEYCNLQCICATINGHEIIPLTDFGYMIQNVEIVGFFTELEASILPSHEAQEQEAQMLNWFDRISQLPIKHLSLLYNSIEESSRDELNLIKVLNKFRGLDSLKLKGGFYINGKLTHENLKSLSLLEFSQDSPKKEARNTLQLSNMPNLVQLKIDAWHMPESFDRKKEEANYLYIEVSLEQLKIIDINLEETQRFDVCKLEIKSSAQLDTLIFADWVYEYIKPSLFLSNKLSNLRVCSICASDLAYLSEDGLNILDVLLNIGTLEHLLLAAGGLDLSFKEKKCYKQNNNLLSLDIGSCEVLDGANLEIVAPNLQTLSLTDYFEGYINCDNLHFLTVTIDNDNPYTENALKVFPCTALKNLKQLEITSPAKEMKFFITQLLSIESLNSLNSLCIVIHEDHIQSTRSFDDLCKLIFPDSLKLINLKNLSINYNDTKDSRVLDYSNDTKDSGVLDFSNAETLSAVTPLLNLLSLDTHKSCDLNKLSHPTIQELHFNKREELRSLNSYETSPPLLPHWYFLHGIPKNWNQSQGQTQPRINASSCDNTMDLNDETTDSIKITYNYTPTLYIVGEGEDKKILPLAAGSELVETYNKISDSNQLEIDQLESLPINFKRVSVEDIVDVEKTIYGQIFVDKIDDYYLVQAKELVNTTIYCIALSTPQPNLDISLCELIPNKTIKLKLTGTLDQPIVIYYNFISYNPITRYCPPNIPNAIPISYRFILEDIFNHIDQFECYPEFYSLISEIRLLPSRDPIGSPAHTNAIVGLVICYGKQFKSGVIKQDYPDAFKTLPAPITWLIEQKGSCVHRSVACFVLLQYLGIPTLMRTNPRHMWISTLEETEECYAYNDKELGGFPAEVNYSQIETPKPSKKDVPTITFRCVPTSITPKNEIERHTQIARYESQERLNYVSRSREYDSLEDLVTSLVQNNTRNQLVVQQQTHHCFDLSKRLNEACHDICSVIYIDGPTQLKQLYEHYYIRENKPVKKAGTLQNALHDDQQNAVLVVINLNRLTKAVNSFKCLLDTPSTFHNKIIQNKKIHFIFCVNKKNIYQLSQAVLSRFQLIHYIDTLQVSIGTKSSLMEQVTYTYKTKSINLYHCIDTWQILLFGSVDTSDGIYTPKPGFLDVCFNEDICHINIINPPHDPDFKAWVHQMETSHTYESLDGTIYRIPDNFITVRDEPIAIKKLSTYTNDDKKNLTATNYLKWFFGDCTINPRTNQLRTTPAWASNLEPNTAIPISTELSTELLALIQDHVDIYPGMSLQLRTGLTQDKDGNIHLDQNAITPISYQQLTQDQQKSCWLLVKDELAFLRQVLDDHVIDLPQIAFINNEIGQTSTVSSNLLFRLKQRDETSLTFEQEQLYLLQALSFGETIMLVGNPSLNLQSELEEYMRGGELKLSGMHTGITAGQIIIVSTQKPSIAQLPTYDVIQQPFTIQESITYSTIEAIQKPPKLLWVTHRDYAKWHLSSNVAHDFISWLKNGGSKTLYIDVDDLQSLDWRCIKALTLSISQQELYVNYEGTLYQLKPEANIIVVGNSTNLTTELNAFLKEFAVICTPTEDILNIFYQQIINEIIPKIHIQKIQNIFSHTYSFCQENRLSLPGLVDIQLINERICSLELEYADSEWTILSICHKVFHSLFIANPESELACYSTTSELLNQYLYQCKSYMEFLALKHFDNDFYITPERAKILVELDNALQDRDNARRQKTLSSKFGVLLEGVSGIGKSTMILKFLEYRNLKNDQDFIFLVAGQEDTESQLINAARNGQIVILDELNISRETMHLLTILMQGFLPSNYGGKSINPGFYIFASQNPPSYQGCLSLPAKLRSLFHRIKVPDYSSDELQKISSEILPNLSSIKLEAFISEYNQCRQKFPMTINARTFFHELKRNKQNSTHKERVRHQKRPATPDLFQNHPDIKPKRRRIHSCDDTAADGVSYQKT